MFFSRSNFEFFKHVTVEPALFLIFLAYNLTDFLNTNLYLQKSCRNNTIQEPLLSSPCDDEKRGVLFISSVYSNFQYVSTLLTMLFTLFATAYSDLAGKKRRIFIILPIFAMLLQSISACLQAYFWYWPPFLGVILDLIFLNSGGGFMCAISFTKIYVCDIAERENRVFRITVLTAIRLICSPISRGMAGYLMHSIGFFYSYCICTALLFMAFLCAWLFVEDLSEPGNRKITIKEVFHFNQIIQSFKIILWTKKPNKHRATIFLLLFIGQLVYFSYVGETSISYLYFRYRFHWDEKQYSLYTCYKMTVGIIGGLLCSLIMSKIFKIHDGIIGTFAGFWDTLAVIAYFLANQNWQLYIIPLIDIFHGVALSTFFSFASKFFDSHEFGRLQSVNMTFGLLIPFGIPLYNLVFKNTIDTFPNAFFLLSIIINFLVCIIYSITYLLSKDVK